MKDKKITTSKGVTSELYYCHTCGKKWQEPHKARKRAYNHAEYTGHRVTGETIIGITYN